MNFRLGDLKDRSQNSLTHLETSSRIPGYLAAPVFIGVLWIVISALVNPFGDFPLNDDWIYASAVKSILQSGRFELPSAAGGNVFIQAYWGALFCLPLGFSFTALRLSTLFLGLGGILACYFLLREIGGSPRISLAGALTLAVNPLYFGLAHTFMTDVPFLTLVIVALFLFIRGIRRQEPLSLLAGTLITLSAILIRQFGLLLLLAFGIAYIVRHGKSWRSLVVAIVPLVVGTGLQVFYHYWALKTGRVPFFSPGIRFLTPPSVAAFARSSSRLIVEAIPYLGFFVAPFMASVALSGGRADSRKRWAICLLVVALASAVIAGLYLEYAPMPQIGNVLMPSGLGPLTLRDTSFLSQNIPAIPIYMKIFWIAVNVIGVLCGVGVILYFANTAVYVGGTLWDLEWRSATSVLILVFIAGYAGILLLMGSNDFRYDRYLLLFAPAIFALILLDEIRFGPIVITRSRGVLWGVLFFVYTALAVAATHDYLAWNRIRWVATRTLMDAGVSPYQIDGGYEFNGWLLSSMNYHVVPNKSSWWVYDDEYIIASGPLRGYKELQRFVFQHWLPVSDNNVVILHRLSLDHH